MRAARRRAAVLVALVTAAVAGLPAAGSLAAVTTSGATTAAAIHGSIGVPAGAPAAAHQREPKLPEPSKRVWPFSDQFSRTSGTGRLAGGASLWTDYLYDDHGAAAPSGFPLSNSAMVSNLAPTQGIAGYTSSKAKNNGADIFRAGVGLTKTNSYWRVDWNTLADKRVPIAEWILDKDDDPHTGATAWPGHAGVSSRGFGTALIVSASGARLVALRTHKATDVATHGGSLTVDTKARSFVVRIPRRLLHVHGTWRVRLGAGVATSDGKSFAEPDFGADSGLSAAQQKALPRVYNVTFRSLKQEPPVYDNGAQTDAQVAAFGAALADSPVSSIGADGLARFVTGNFWMEDHQADVLASGGDVSRFSRTVKWSRLLRHARTAEPRPTGYSNRWYVSRLHLGQGAVANNSNQPSGDLRPNYLGRVQPYAVYVPRGTRFANKQPLTWVLHSLGVNHNQYGALDPKLLKELCQDRHSICASTEGYGPDGWYFNEAENDFWSVWHALSTTYRLSAERTVISGYSMGGWASFKLALAHPDLFSESMPLEGPPVCGIRIAYLFNGQSLKAPADGQQPGACGTDGDSVPLLGNALWLPYVITQGGTEELVPAPSNLQTTQLLDQLGERYTLFFLPEEDHLAYATQDRFAGVVKALGGTPSRVKNPARISYAWFPNLRRQKLGIGTTTAYWLSGLQSTTTAPGKVAQVTATSGELRDPAVTDKRSGPDEVSTPLPALRTRLTWELGKSASRHDRLSLHLTKVSKVTVDSSRAKLRCPAITVSSDTKTRLTLTRLRQGVVVHHGKRATTIHRGRRYSVNLEPGTSHLRVTCG